jgi:hypothetical protein
MIVKFIGRKIGAIGIRYTIQEKIKSMTLDEATKLMYEKYEHISGLEICND